MDIGITGGPLVIFAFILGSIIGSFLNVVIYRLHTNRSLQGRSHCLSCGHMLHWYELIPIGSFIALRGRCRTCGSFISPRYLFVELLMGMLSVLVFLTYSDAVLIVFYLAILSVLMVVTVYDIRHTIIPDEAVLIVSALVLGEVVWSGYIGQPQPAFPDLIIGGLVASLFFLSLWRGSRGRWIGLGDAKLALPLGFIVGWPSVISLIILSFWIGAAISLIILGIQYLSHHFRHRGKTGLSFRLRPLTMKSEIPFAPFLVLSFVLVHFFSANIFSITYTLLPIL